MAFYYTLKEEIDIRKYRYVVKNGDRYLRRTRSSAVQEVPLDVADLFATKLQANSAIRFNDNKGEIIKVYLKFEGE